jgi:glycosyltransferase involved in cell wall biosynthesis
MTIYIVDLEAVDTRYTKEWKYHLPRQLKKATNHEVVSISGGDTPQATTPGAFLNFGGTNVYKANQMQQIGKMFCDGKVKNGDYFLYTDAWNPTVLQLKYMAELLKVKIKIGGMWHAGSYDPQDFLGRLIGDKPWVRNTEQAMFDTFDHNFFATQFHIDLFTKTFEQAKDNNKVIRAGWPMEYMEPTLDLYQNMEKKNKILFPHRLAPEKQPAIFQDLKNALPQYEFVTCQERPLTKNEYHNLLGEAKLMFSANLQETLGISWYEGAILNVIPMIPDRLSYSEMAMKEFLYPSDWTENMESYRANKKHIIARIEDYMENYKKYVPAVLKQKQRLKEQFFSGTKLYGAVSNG